jgi:hypothetical protein
MLVSCSPDLCFLIAHGSSYGCCCLFLSVFLNVIFFSILGSSMLYKVTGQSWISRTLMDTMLSRINKCWCFWHPLFCCLPNVSLLLQDLRPSFWIECPFLFYDVSIVAYVLEHREHAFWSRFLSLAIPNWYRLDSTLRERLYTVPPSKYTIWFCTKSNEDIHYETEGVTY